MIYYIYWVFALFNCVSYWVTQFCPYIFYTITTISIGYLFILMFFVTLRLKNNLVNTPKSSLSVSLYH